MKSLAFVAGLDAVAQAELVRTGELSAGELLDACEERIEALDPLLRAISALELDRARNAAPVSGPFTGVPFLMKDVSPYPGLPWRMGARAFARNVASVGTPFTERLDAAGLVTIGKSTTSELGLLGSTETLLEGITHNPWELSHSAAGSSGGAAAAVAAGLVPLAHANDGGGSIRIPSSVCGLFGFKPSRGRTVAAALASSDFGDLVSDHCVTRSVRDSALFLSITEAREVALPPVGHVKGPSARRLRVGAWTQTLTGEAPDTAIARVHDEVVALLEELGHEVVPLAPPPVDGGAICDAFFLMAGVAMNHLVGFLTQTQGRAPSRRDLEPFTWALAEEAQRKGPDGLHAAREAFARGARAYVKYIEQVDVVLTPTLATPPWRIGHLSPMLDREELIARTARSVGYTPIHNIAGCPAMSVPLAWTDAGLPLGAHFAAPPGADAVLLELAYELELARPWSERWAPYSYPVLFGGRSSGPSEAKKEAPCPKS